MAIADDDSILPIISINGVGAIAATIEPINIKPIAISCIRFLPNLSEILPAGSKKAPIVNMPESAIHDALDNGRLKSFAIVGKATFKKNISNETNKLAHASIQKTCQGFLFTFFNITI